MAIIAVPLTATPVANGAVLGCAMNKPQTISHGAKASASISKLLARGNTAKR